jgi:lipoprotein
MDEKKIKKIVGICLLLVILAVMITQACTINSKNKDIKEVWSRISKYDINLSVNDLINLMYQRALDAYDKVENDTVIILEEQAQETEIDGKMYVKLVGYEDNIEKLFTEKERKVYEEKVGILQKNEEYYLPTEKRQTDASYIETTFEDIKEAEINENGISFKLKCNAVSHYSNGETKTSEFILIKEEQSGRWLIDTFTLPN